MPTSLELSQQVEGKHWGDSVHIRGIRRLDKAEALDLSLMLRPQDKRHAVNSKAGCLLISKIDAADFADELSCTLIVVCNPFAALQKAMEFLYPAQPKTYFQPHIHSSVYIHPKAQIKEGVIIFPFVYTGSATIGKNTKVHPFVFIDDDVEIGEECIIGAGSVLLAGTKIENRVTIQPGVVIGSEGFVYYAQNQRNIKLSSIAGVTIADDVEIGAHSCIDRGMLENTTIGRGSKTDNLVQIGHDVTIGDNVAIVAQAGIAGHVSIGNETMIGGQAGIAPHCHIGQGTRISATAAAFHDVDPQKIVSGNPAIPHLDFLRTNAALKNLRAHQKEVKELGKRVRCLEEIIKNHGII